MTTGAAASRPGLLVLASTYPRWRGDHEPGFVHELCKRLAGRFRVVVIAPDSPGADPSGELDGVEVLRYRYAPRAGQTLVHNGGIAVNLKRSAWKWLLVPSFIAAQYIVARRVLRTREVALIHAHWLIPQGLVARALSHRAPYVVTSHGGDLFGLRGALPTALKRWVARGARALTVVSSAMRGEAARLQLMPPRVEVIPMGADLSERFRPDPQAARSADELLFVGRLVRKKGLHVLLDALPAILQRRPAVHLRIAGFGPEEESLRRQAERLGVSAAVTFAGAMPQERLPALYRHAALLVAPFIRDESGNQEGLPVVLMEAIGCACPVVAGDVAGVQDLLGDDYRELRSPPGDVPALADAVLRALDDPIGMQRRVAEVREAALPRLEWNRIAEAYADLLMQSIEAAA